MMDWNEAKQLMERGVKMTHHYFSPNEWITIDGDQLLFEDGVRCSFYDFIRWRRDWYNDGWSVYECSNKFCESGKIDVGYGEFMSCGICNI